MKKLFLSGLLTTITFFVFAQDINTIINAKEVERIEKILSADDMQGRKTFTPAIDKAADFIKIEGTSLDTGASSFRVESNLSINPADIESKNGRKTVIR